MGPINSAIFSLTHSLLAAKDSSFFELVDKNEKLNKIATENHDFAHEAPVWIPATNELFFVSNRLDSENKTISGFSNKSQHIQMYKLKLDTKEVIPVFPKPEILMANGAFRISDDEIVVCSQGYRNKASGLFKLNVRTLESVELVNSFNYLPLNSLNDVIYSHFFNGFFMTDPPYGQTQGFRDAASLPPSVWFYSQITGKIKPLIQNVLVKPNGVALSLDSKTLYVTESGFFVDGPKNTDVNVPRVIYQFDVFFGSDNTPEVSNRKIFANVDVGIADGIKLDNRGNVYAGVGDGVNVYSPSGIFLGKIAADPNGISNLVFANDTLVMMAEKNIFSLKMKVQGAPSTD